MNRTKLLMRNVFSGLGSKILSLVLNFASRTIFIMYLGNAYLGINGLFTNILSVLSFAELGFGTALNFALYKPIANGDKILTVQLLNYYKRVYQIIVAIIIVAGAAIIPAVPYLVKGADNITKNEIMIFYVLNLFNTVISYFVSYKSTYVNACQKGYIVTMYDAIINAVIVIVQIVVILVSKMYLAYIIMQSVLLLISKVGLNFYINRKFPIVKEKATSQLPTEEKKSIKANVKGMVMHKFAAISVNNTDNIIISSMISVVVVGLVSNYNMIITNVVGFLNIIFRSFSATFGDIYAKDDTDAFYNHFVRVNYINFLLYSFCSICFFVLIPPFITLWIGKENLIDTASFILIVLNGYMVGQSSILLTARDAVGNYNADKWHVMIEALINLVVSLIAVQYLDLLGVYIGTIISRIYFIAVRPAVSYKLMFDRSARRYYLSFILYLSVAIIGAVIAYFATQYILQIEHWGYFILGALLTAIIAVIVSVLCTCWTKEFKSTYSYIKSKMAKKVKKVAMAENGETEEGAGEGNITIDASVETENVNNYEQEDGGECKN